ncbi:winged helix-turn-helix domain-containing protein [uncultured Ferrimonas sp.]|uniref:winged helix-turn-helix domain-containing protein n=1 Tax=uncultured Ferrimonas sp. TaxID=432640 RepID=UPI00261342F0|nr:winged helix-turn-helix domain-containing protein [uncultured Ferrimonas sp.]
MGQLHAIGCCRYDLERGELRHPDKAKPWHLPRVEQQLLRHLVQQRGQVLSKQQLRLDQQQQLAFSNSAVVKGIFTLRHYIGTDSHQLLQTVTGQGYCLAPLPQSNHADPLLPIRSGSWQPWAGLTLAALLAVVLAWPTLQRWAINPSHSNAQQQISQIHTANGDAITIYSMANSLANSQLLASNRQRLATTLERCLSSRWDRAYMALSHDGMMLNITLIADLLNSVQLRNIKISDFRINTDFLSNRWIKEANLCD